MALLDRVSDDPQDPVDRCGPYLVSGTISRASGASWRKSHGVTGLEVNKRATHLFVSTLLVHIAGADMIGSSQAP
jgi:hypothetical protein